MKKIIYLSIICFFLAFWQTSQAQIVFSKEYGGLYNEDGRWMEQMPDSGYIMVGRSDTYSNGQSDIWVVRSDAYGNVMWTKSYGGAQFDFGNMIRITSDGGFIIAGFTNSYGAGGNDGWLIKTDVMGNVQWQRTFGNSGLQEFEAVIQTSDGGYAALGINYSSGTQYYDFYLVKTDSLGNLEFEKNIGSGGFEIGNSIQQTPDGGFILAGQSYSYGGEDGDFYMVKTNSLGVVQWFKNYALPGLQEAHHVQNVPGGGFVLVGDADDLPNGFGQTDVWLIRTDDLGDTLWTRNYGGTKKDGGKTVENTIDGGFIIAGISRSFGLINPNYYLIKTNHNGITEWQNYTYGSAHHDHAYRAIQTSDGGFAEFGYFRNSSSSSNYALVKLAPTGGVTKDVAVDEIALPGPTVCRSLSVPVEVTLTNYGNTNEIGIAVSVMVMSGSNVIHTIYDTLQSPLLPSFTSRKTFSESIQFPAAGTYELIAAISHRTNDVSFSNDTTTLVVTVVDPVQNPATSPGIRCNTGTVSMSASQASPDDSLFWYDAASGGNLLYMGQNYTSPSLSSTTTYYVEAIKGKGSKAGPVDNTFGSGGTSSSSYLKFDSRINWTLVSVKVYASTAGNRTIELRDASNNLLQSKTANVPVGESRVYLNFSVPPGNDFRLGLGAGSGALFRNNSGVTYPYSVSRVLEIYGSSGGSGSYYYFYDWEVFVPYLFCKSDRIPVDAVIGTGTATALDKFRCGNGTVTLTANSSQSLAWYNAPNGGTLLGTGSSYTTPSLSSTTSYYLEVGSCPNRLQVQAIINSVSTAPVAPNVNHCGPGVVTLNASATDPVRWYDAISNGLLLGTGNTFNTPYINSTTTYYARAGTTCPSSAVAVNAIINSTAAPSTVPASACGPASVTLSASSASPLEWYNVATGGNVIGTGSNFVTPVLSSSVTYYVQAVSTCASTRVPVTATITVVDPPIPSGASHCGAASMVISAASTDPVTWWTDVTGGTQIGSGLNYTTPVLNATTTYYAQASNGGCNSQRVAVTAEIIITPPPSIVPGANCGPGSVTLSASSSEPISWYSVPAGGTQIGSGSTYITPSLNTTTTYYVSAGTSCPSVRVPVSAVIASTSADPVVTNGSRCGPGTVELSASSPDPVSWYDAPNGTLLGSGLTFTTPSISSNATYYAVAGIAGCFSSFVPVTATVNSQPASPIITDAQNCGPAMLTLSAAASDPVTWYDASVGGNIVNTGGTYQTTFNTTTTLYVESYDGICPSIRIPVTATIFTLPSVVLGPDTVNIISGQSTILDAGSGYTSYLWSTGATSQTLLVSTAGIVYVSVVDTNNCTGTDTIVVNIITGVEHLADKFQVSVFPNPGTGIFELRVENAKSDMQITIMDVIGKKIFNDFLVGSLPYHKSIDLSEHSKGIYFLQLFTPEGIISTRILIQ